MKESNKPRLKFLKNDLEYEQALEYVKYLIDEGFALPGTEEENTVEVFSVLIEKYEEEKGLLIPLMEIGSNFNLSPLPSAVFQPMFRNLKN